MVKVNGDMWRAVSFDDNVTFEQGDYVIIDRVEGAHVVVKPKEIEKTDEH